jgi:general secretion pathway protein H
MALADGTAIDRKPAARRLSGFSLLELLVVVVIIGILATMMTLSLGVTGGDRDLEQDVKRLRALLALASEDALLQGRELGITFIEDGYEFALLDPDENRWVRLQGDPVLKSRSFDDGIELAIEIEGREVRLQTREEFNDQFANVETEADDSEDQIDDDSPFRGRNSEFLPQIFIFSSGEISPPFEARMRREFQDLVLVLAAKPDGSLEITRESY